MLFTLAMVALSLGTGGIKPNVSPCGKKRFLDFLTFFLSERSGWRKTFLRGKKTQFLFFLFFQKTLSN